MYIHMYKYITRDLYFRSLLIPKIAELVVGSNVPQLVSLNKLRPSRVLQAGIGHFLSYSLSTLSPHPTSQPNAFTHITSHVRACHKAALAGGFYVYVLVRCEITRSVPGLFL